MAREIIQLADLMKDAGLEIAKATSRPNIYGYKPYPKQEAAHRVDKFGRLILGGNRAGKTDWNVVEQIWWLTGTHPYLQTPEPPIQGRCVVVDIVKGIDGIMLPKFKRWLAPDMLIDGSWDKSYDERRKTLTLSNGSTVDFLTYEMDLDKHGGVPRHYISFDEEPPQHIFNEGMMRLVDYDGKWWASLTPLQGLTWMHEYLYEPVKNDPEGEVAQQVFITEMSQADNPYLQANDRGKFSIAMTKEERDSREHGKFVAASGLIFPDFKKETHVLPEPIIPPKTWEWYMSMDEGWNNPTAVLWHAVSPEGIIVTFSEHYAREMTLGEHAQVIHTREALFGRVPDLRTGDPAMKQKSTQTGVSKLQMLSDYGIDLSVEGVPHDVEPGILKMQQYLRVSKVTGKPRWFITPNCVNFIREMQSLRWASFASAKARFDQNKQEKVHKKNDHTFDSARYFATLLPDLAPEEADATFLMPTKVPPPERYDTMLLRTVQDPDATVQWDIQEQYEDFFS